MTKITVDIPGSLISRIDGMWNELVGSVNIELSKRKLVLWALEQFAQSGVQRTPGGMPGGITDVSANGDKQVIKVMVDIPEQLFGRLDEMWKSFVESANIGLSKRKLVLWALERFAQAPN